VRRPSAASPAGPTPPLPSTPARTPLSLGTPQETPFPPWNSPLRDQRSIGRNSGGEMMKDRIRTRENSDYFRRTV